MARKRFLIAGALLSALLCAQIVVVPTKKKAAPTPAPATNPAPKPAQVGESIRYCSEFGYMRIALSAPKTNVPPAELILIDPQKRRLGADPIRQSDFTEIPRGNYSTTSQDDEAKKITGPKSKVIELCSPATGYYQLQVIGSGSGDYDLGIQASNREVLDSSGRPMMLDSRVDQPTASIRRGVTQIFTLYYSRTPGVKVRLRPAK